MAQQHVPNLSDLPNLPDFPDELREYSPVEILSIAHEAKDTRGTFEQKLALMRGKHPDFWFRYPKLLETCCQPNVDMEQLGFMLNMLSAVKKQKTSMDDADREVHQRLAQSFNVATPAASQPVASSQANSGDGSV